jgi:hypothetical protein
MNNSISLTCEDPALISIVGLEIVFPSVIGVSHGGGRAGRREGGRRWMVGGGRGIATFVHVGGRAVQKANLIIYLESNMEPVQGTSSRNSVTVT